MNLLPAREKDPNFLLQDFIRLIRACKTAEAERAVVKRECAMIRGLFKDEDLTYRVRSMAKLVFISLLGYDASFGQLECMKMISSSNFAEKRYGYLGILLLFSPDSDKLMLLTNSIKSDLENTNQFVVGYALSTLASLGNTDMLRDLSNEVSRLIVNPNTYVRKKAALCMLRILRVCPDIIEPNIPRMRALFNEKNHGVLLAACSLISEVCRSNKALANQFYKLLPAILRMLKDLASASFAPDYDVGGLADPFLQIQLLRVLRMIFADVSGDKGIKGINLDNMADVLATVATNTETTRAAGYSVLYECARVISAVCSGSGSSLRVLGVNILSRLLASKDVNNKYVALSTLAEYSKFDRETVQRHRHTVMECLKDIDISIRRVALELVYALATPSSVVHLTKELLKALEGETEDRDFRREIASKISVIVEIYSPNAEWRFDTMLHLLSLAGNNVSEEVVVSFIATAKEHPDLREHAVSQLMLALSGKDFAVDSALVESSRRSSSVSAPLAIAAVWVLGEYADSLEAFTIVQDIATNVAVSTIDGNIGMFTRSSTRLHAVLATAKIASRNEAFLNEAITLLSGFEKNKDVELQQRSLELSRLLRDGKLKEIIKSTRNHDEIAKMGVTGAPAKSSNISQVAGEGSQLPASKSEDLLLLDIFSSGPAQTQTQQPQPQTQSQPAAAPSIDSEQDDLVDLLGGLGSQKPVREPAWKTADFELMTEKKSQRNTERGEITEFSLLFNSSTGRSLENIQIKAAVPKYLQLKMLPPSSTSLAEGATLVQEMKLLNSSSPRKTLMVKLRVEYVLKGQFEQKVEQTTLTFDER